MTNKTLSILRAVFAAVFVFSVFCSSAFCAEEVFNVEEVILTGTRVEEGVPVDKLPAPVLSIKGDDLKKTGEQSLPEMLSKFAGFHYMDTVGLGGDAKLHLRGFGEFPGNIVLLDGVRINESASHEVFWKSIPLDAIEKIEVLKGGVSSTYGEGALTGVVNIITKNHLQKNTVSALWSGYGKQEYSIMGGAPLGKLNVLANGYYEKNKGFRSKSNYDGKGAFLKISNNAVSTKYTLSVNVHKNATDIPDSLTDAQLSSDSKQGGDCLNNFENSNSTVSLSEIYHFKGFSTTTNMYYRKRDSLGKMTCPAFAFTSENKTDGKAYGGVIQFNKKTEKNALTAGVEYGKEFFDNTPTGDPTDVVNKKNLALYLQDIYEFSPKMNVSAGLRWDDVKFDMTINQFDVVTFTKQLAFKGQRKATAASPKFGLNYRASDKVSLYASYSKSFLAPTGFQFLGIANPYLSNPRLDPTVSREVSFGFRFKGKSTKTDVNFFQMKTTNEILFNNETFAQDNFDVKRSGAEVSIESQWPPKISSLVSYSFLDSSFEKDKTYFGKNILGKSMPLAPESTLGLDLSYAATPALDLNFSSTFVYNFFPLNDLNNEKKVKDYNVTNLKASYKTKWGNVSAYLNNFFNARYSSFPTSNGQSGAARVEKFNPQPERTIGFSMQYDF